MSLINPQQAIEESQKKYFLNLSNLVKSIFPIVKNQQ